MDNKFRKEELLSNLMTNLESNDLTSNDVVTFHKLKVAFHNSKDLMVREFFV